MQRRPFLANSQPLPEFSTKIYQFGENKDIRLALNTLLLQGLSQPEFYGV